MALASAVPGVMAQSTQRDEVSEVIGLAALAYWDLVVDLFSPTAAVSTLAVGITQHDGSEFAPSVAVVGLGMAWCERWTLRLGEAHQAIP